MGTLNPKERLDEIQSTGRRQRAAAFVAEIKRHGESVRDVFAKGSCDTCDGKLARYDGPRGFVCVNGHRADRGAAKRRLDADHAKAVTLADGDGALRRASAAGRAAAGAGATEKGRSTVNPTIHIYDVIGDGFGSKPVLALDVAEQVKAIEKAGHKTVDVFVASPGGDVFQAIAIHNTLQRSPLKVTMHVDSLAASAASLVLMAGDRIIAAPSSVLMAHMA